MELTNDFIGAIYDLVVHDEGFACQIMDEYGDIICDIAPEQVQIIPYKYKDDESEETRERFTNIYNILESSSSFDEAFRDFDIYLNDYISYCGISRPLSASDLEPFYLYYVKSKEEFLANFNNDGFSCTFKLDTDLSQDTFVMAAQHIDGELIIVEPDKINIVDHGMLEITYLGNSSRNFYDDGYTLLIKERDRQIPTITFDANSGTFPTSGETQTAYNSTELTGSTTLSSIVETPTKPGYVFQGWSTTSTGAVQYTQASMPTISSDTTLYAIYEPDTTKVLLEKGAVDIILGKLKR